MGLDMYLMKAPRLDSVTIQQVWATEEWFGYCKRPNEYRTSSFEEWCGASQDDLPSEKVMEVLRPYYVERFASWDTNHVYPHSDIIQDVGIMCQPKAYEMFKKEFDLIGPHKILKRGDYHLLIWEWVKWYTEFEDVAKIEEIMNELGEHEDEDGYGYKFLRIGEDDTDVEDITNNCEVELWMRREIDIPKGFEEVNKDD